MSPSLGGIGSSSWFQFCGRFIACRNAKIKRTLAVLRLAHKPPSKRPRRPLFSRLLVGRLDDGHKFRQLNFETVEARVLLTNNAPVLVHTALAGSAERDTTQPNPGVLVSSLTGGISDADPGALKGIAIVGIDQAHGALQYSSNGGSTWTSVVSPSTSNALLLPADANTRVRLVPSDTFLGTIADGITFRAWDQTSGTADTYANTTNSGGSTAFSTATDTVSMTIDPAVGAQIQANSDSAGTHTPVGTALDAQGNSVVAWTVVSGSNTNLMARSYSRSGSPLGAQFQVNAAGTSVSSAAVAMNANGTSIFVWSVYANNTYTVYSQRFNNSTGAAIDSAPVSLFTNTSVSYLSVGIATNNGYVVSFGTSGTTNFTVQHQTTAGPRTLLACVFDANNVLPVRQPDHRGFAEALSIYNASLSVAGDGSFVVDWTSYASGYYQIQALRITRPRSSARHEHATASPRAAEREHRRASDCRTSGREFCRSLGATRRQQLLSSLDATFQRFGRGLCCG